MTTEADRIARERARQRGMKARAQSEAAEKAERLKRFQDRDELIRLIPRILAELKHQGYPGMILLNVGSETKLFRGKVPVQVAAWWVGTTTSEWKEAHITTQWHLLSDGRLSRQAIIGGTDACRASQLPQEAVTTYLRMLKSFASDIGVS